MFRKAREHSSIDVGRPPTPPVLLKASALAEPTHPKMATTASPRVLKEANVRQERRTPSSTKTKAGGNGSILNFFKKANSTNEDSLFIVDDDASAIRDSKASPTTDIQDRVNDDGGRYNENGGPVKRRRTSNAMDGLENGNPIPQKRDTNPNATDKSMEESVSGAFEGDGNITRTTKTIKAEPECEFDNPLRIEDTSTKPHIPSLRRAATSVDADLFDGMEDFVEDEFPEEGEEFLERQYMEEQRLLEQEFENDEDLNPAKVSESTPITGEDTTIACPVCMANLSWLDSEKASVHVNNCLDGNPTPVPPPPVKKEEVEEVKKEEIEGVKREGGEETRLLAGPSHKRFQRAAIARPGQENPFQLGSTTSGGSAFSKLMSSHAEDEAWATAAANETSARGKPAFKRTCPFYKILPGFFICVDAFRYGAVEGCRAYFLSHFHSDHYIGLTSTWSHGPIYCSRVTGNLVRQQLRVDPKWVVDLEFEKGQEVPGTQGVHVTMIPANHCPGSSLFLFEKVVGRGSNPRKQRILHCGDFRACTAQVKHPLLRPDVIDIARGGQKREQKLDVCYLDTTYLTPKYAFPGQEDVIKACADMCVSLSKDKVDEGDDWEQTKKQRAGSGMVKFVRKTTGDNATEDSGDGDGKGRRDPGRGRLLVVVGTYSIGKERICLGVARALNSKIFAPPRKLKICAALEDAELSSRLTGDPLEAQVHMQMLMEIRPETLADYLTSYKPHFSRIVGFRPSGWNYRPPNSRFVESPLVQTVLHSDNWKSRYSMAELVPQRGSTRDASCFGVPYSEHSSFRELSMFCCALRIDKIIPTVNVGSAKSREKMKGWIEKWAAEKKKNGLFRVSDDEQAW